MVNFLEKAGSHGDIPLQPAVAEGRSKTANNGRFSLLWIPTVRERLLHLSRQCRDRGEIMGWEVLYLENSSDCCKVDFGVVVGHPEVLVIFIRCIAVS